MPIEALVANVLVSKYVDHLPLYCLTSSGPVAHGRRTRNSNSEDVVEALERVGRMYGFPKMILVDQGTEFVSKDLDLWA